MSTERRSNLKLLARAERSQLELAQQSFMLSRQAMGCTGQTLKWYSNYLPKVLAYFKEQGIHDAANIAPDAVRGFYVHLQQRGLAAQTIFNYGTVLKAFFNYLVEEELLTQNPMKRVKMPRLPKKILPALSPEEVQRLLDACLTTRDRAIILVAVDSGLRVSELVNLSIEDINIQSGEIMVHEGKGRKDRTAYLGSTSRRILLKYLMQRGATRPEDALWCSETTGRRLTHHGLRLALKRVGHRAGVQNSSPHSLRRSNALWSLRAGMSPFALKMLLGHADLNTTNRYLDLVKEDLADAHRKHGAVDNML